MISATWVELEVSPTFKLKVLVAKAVLSANSSARVWREYSWVSCLRSSYPSAVWFLTIRVKSQSSFQAHSFCKGINEHGCSCMSQKRCTKNRQQSSGHATLSRFQGFPCDRSTPSRSLNYLLTELQRSLSRPTRELGDIVCKPCDLTFTSRPLLKVRHRCRRKPLLRLREYIRLSLLPIRAINHPWKNWTWLTKVPAWWLTSRNFSKILRNHTWLVPNLSCNASCNSLVWLASNSPTKVAIWCNFDAWGVKPPGRQGPRFPEQIPPTWPTEFPQFDWDNKLGYDIPNGFPRGLGAPANDGCPPKPKPETWFPLSTVLLPGLVVRCSCRR